MTENNLTDLKNLKKKKKEELLNFKGEMITRCQRQDDSEVEIIMHIL